MRLYYVIGLQPSGSMKSLRISGLLLQGERWMDEVVANLYVLEMIGRETAKQAATAVSNKLNINVCFVFY